MICGWFTGGGGGGGDKPCGGAVAAMLLYAQPQISQFTSLQAIPVRMRQQQIELRQCSSRGVFVANWNLNQLCIAPLAPLPAPGVIAI